MKTLRIAALAVAVSGVFTLGAKAGTSTNDWWDVDFEALADYVPDDPAQAMVVLTNQTIVSDGKTNSVQTWDSGIWYTQDGDETIVTNEYNGKTSTMLKLDTQGNDLTWSNSVAAADSLTALVDADLYLVGSDSPPDTGDFDAAHDVQTAVYLKNLTDEDSGETTNSVLCVYVYDSDAEENYWQELKGVTWVRELPEGGTETLDGLKDNDWASVKVVVDHAKVIDPQNNYPVVQVFVNGVKMTARDGDVDHWTVANSAKSQTAGRVSSVAFRGTGAVDNFVGKLVETTFDKYDFTAEVYMNGTLVAQGTEGNVTRVVEQVEAGAGKTAPFRNFFQDDLSVDASTMPPVFNVSYYLSKIEFTNCLTGATTTFNYSYSNYRVVPATVNEDFVQLSSTGMPPYNFSVTAPTEGATENTTLVRIYFEDVPAVGDFTLTASQNVGTAPADQKFNNKDENLPESTTFEFNQQIAAGGTDYYLSGIMTNATPAGIAVGVEDAKVVVTVPLSASIAEGAYNVATATYVEGSVAGKTAKLVPAEGGYTVAYSDPPVAIIVAGNVTNEFSSLRAAIEASAAGDTITLVADDHVSFSAESTEIAIGKSLTIDGGSNTLYGVSGYAYDGVNDHDIFIGAAAGDVTIKDLRITEFSDTAPTVQYRTYPIWTSQGYAGKLTLDGVQIDKFARTAINLGNGTFEITNCVITGYAGATGAPERYFQNAFGVFKAKGTVADTTAAGLGSTAEPWGAGVVTFNSDGDGELTFLSGSYKSDYVLEVSSNATGRLVIEGGTFVATAAAADSAFQLDEGDDATFKVAISGGWFDREPEAKYIAEGLSAVNYGSEAPNAAAPWTVEGAKVTVTWVITETSSNMVQVAVGSQVSAYEGDDVVNGTKKFKFWSTDGTTEATFPVTAAGNLTFFAVWEDAAVDPIAVDPGTSLTAADKENGDLPIEVTAAGFVVKFRSSQPGIVYQLVAAGTCDLTEDQWKGVAASGNAVPVEGASKTSSATTSETNTELITLTAPMTDNVKFFKIRASLPAGN